MARDSIARSYQPDQPPIGTDVELAEYLTRELRRIAIAAGLGVEAGDDQDADLATHTHTGSDGTLQVSHPDLLNRNSPDQHNIASITDLQDELDLKASIAGSLATFSFAAYMRIACPSNSPFQELTDGNFKKLDIITINTTTPRGFTVYTVDSEFSVDHEGVYFLSFSGVLDHNSSNSGRKLEIIMYDYTDGVTASSAYSIATGRNQESTNMNFSALFTIQASEVNHRLAFLIRNSSGTYTAPTGESTLIFPVLTASMFAVSEWREDFT